MKKYITCIALDSVQRADAKFVNLGVSLLQSHTKLRAEDNNAMPFQQALWSVGHHPSNSEVFAFLLIMCPRAKTSGLRKYCLSAVDLKIYQKETIVYEQTMESLYIILLMSVNTQTRKQDLVTLLFLEKQKVWLCYCCTVHRARRLLLKKLRGIKNPKIRTVSAVLGTLCSRFASMQINGKSHIGLFDRA